MFKNKTHLLRAARFTAIVLLCALLHVTAHGQSLNVAFSTTGTGLSKSIPTWGTSSIGGNDIIQNTLIYMGLAHANFIVVPVPMTNAPANGTLTGTAATLMTSYLSSIAALSSTTPLAFSIDTAQGVNAYYITGTELVDPTKWAGQLLAAKTFVNRPVAWIQPFNEPDYGWSQGSQQNLSDSMAALLSSTAMSPTTVAGPACLNVDTAVSWYNAISSNAPIGTTHCLAGSVASYVTFMSTVQSHGGIAYHPELHSLAEAIIGANYGLAGGVWWLRSDLARGSFVNACQGRQLGYTEDRNSWTAAAVYSGTDGKYQAFLSGAERQGLAKTYRFYAMDRNVFYDGNGPRRDYTVPTGTDFDQVVNITWGSDVPPPIGGKYIIVNRNSGKVIEVAGASTANGAVLQQNAYTSGSYQQWNISRFAPTAGDLSYSTIANVNDNLVFDDNNSSYSDNARIQQWANNSGLVQNWFFQYAGNGFFYIRNRWSGKYLGILNNSTANAAAVRQSALSGSLSQQWRLMPVTSAIEFTPPAAPTGLSATANAVSISLAWNANTESDLAGYNVLRATTSGGPYDTIARGLTAPSYTDYEANQATTYYYVVQAVDLSVNTSAISAQASAIPAGGAALVASYPFDGTAADASINNNTASVSGSATYGAGHIGSGAITLDGATNYVSLPATVANFDQITIAGWVYWNGGSAWQRLFDFGRDTSHYLFLTPSSGSGTLRFAINNGSGEQIVETTVLPIHTWTHITVTLAGSITRLYVNGVNVASNTGMTLKPTNFMPPMNAIGRSQFSADPLFSGMVDDFHVYNYALSSSDITTLTAGAPAAPASVTGTSAPSSIQLTWNAVPNATSYTVKYATLSGGPYTTLATGLTTPGFTHTPLNFGTTYYYIVDALNVAGSSADSSPASGSAGSVLITAAEPGAVKVVPSVQGDGTSTATVTVPASVPGHTYQLQFTSDLTNQSWGNIGTPQSGNGGPLGITIPSGTASPRGFYRVTISR